MSESQASNQATIATQTDVPHIDTLVSSDLDEAIQAQRTVLVDTPEVGMEGQLVQPSQLEKGDALHIEWTTHRSGGEYRYSGAPEVCYGVVIKIENGRSRIRIGPEKTATFQTQGGNHPLVLGVGDTIGHQNIQSLVRVDTGVDDPNTYSENVPDEFAEIEPFELLKLHLLTREVRQFQLTSINPATGKITGRLSSGEGTIQASDATIEETDAGLVLTNHDQDTQTLVDSVESDFKITH